MIPKMERGSGPGLTMFLVRFFTLDLRRVALFDRALVESNAIES